jgi:Hydrazine synthase alpha subunit middle domain
MRRRARLLCSLGFAALVMLACGFATEPSQKGGTDVIVTASADYKPLAPLQGGERFSKDARLLLLHEGKAEPLVPDFATSADANVSFDGKNVLFAGRKTATDSWQIWELTLANRSVRQITTGSEDAIRPMYLPGWRFVYALRTARGFQLHSARLVESKAIEEIEGRGAQSLLPLTYMNASAVPTDVLADGRILFEAGFPLGSGSTPEMFRVYADGSGVESYRCDHSAARWGGRQLASGDVIFTHGDSLARFTSAMAHEEKVNAPRGEYAGGIAETASGTLLVSMRDTPNGKYSLRLWTPGRASAQLLLVEPGENLVDPVLVGERRIPRRHPSALHDWNYANMLALDARVSRDGELSGTPVTVRVEAQDGTGKATMTGTALVEADGSFFVKVPADRAIRFALLDAKGDVLREEKGWFWIRNGEQRICVGCHAGPEHASENKVPGVLLRTTTATDVTGVAQTERTLSGGVHNQSGSPGGH